MRTVHLVVPEGIHEIASGGNVYDAHVSRGLGVLGWQVLEVPVPGCWPAPGAEAAAGLRGALAAVPDAGLVLVDGLLASAVPAAVAAEARRLRLVVLVHLAAGALDAAARPAEGTALAAARAVVAVSGWTRDRLLGLYALSPSRVHVVRPGVERAEVAAGTPAGGQLLCVAAVTRGKGHDVLVDAVASLPGTSWRCVCVGPLDRDPSFAHAVREQVRRRGLSARWRFAGTLSGAALDAAYAAADVLVQPTRAETYGLVVTEALARGLPVIASGVGGLPEALGRAPDGTVPGLLVPPDDPAALAGALTAWLADRGLRDRLRDAARGRRDTLTGWPDTCAALSRVLAAVPRDRLAG